VSGGLPGYARRLDAMHRALEGEFRDLVHRAPLGESDKVLDAGCGDGFFTALLAERLPTGQAIGLDRSAAYLEAASARLAPQVAAGRVRLVEGDVRRLPFNDGALDAVWSTHCMESYDDIPAVLAEFRRVLRPSGALAVLETDNVHSIMLSWPPDLELAVRQAEHRNIGDEDSYLGTYFPRFALRLLHAAGFENVTRNYVLIQRQRPADGALAEYVSLYINHLADEVGDRLSPSNQTRLRALGDPASERFLPCQEGFFFGSLQSLVTGRVPASAT
jgi:ubiquinone/menaquinone biosynthesis C-methylase UbiE